MGLLLLFFAFPFPPILFLNIVLNHPRSPLVRPIAIVNTACCLSNRYPDFLKKFSHKDIVLLILERERRREKERERDVRLKHELDASHMRPGRGSNTQPFGAWDDAAVN